MNTAALRARVHPLLLAGPMMPSPEDVIGHFGCVQAQDFAMAKWAVARRVDGLTDAALNAAFETGRFLRVHILRPTWHFVRPEDFGWIMTLTAPRVRRLMGSTNKQWALGTAELDRAADVIAAALAIGPPLTRAQLAQYLAAAGVDASGTRLAHIVIHAELDARICSGPPAGKQHTYRPAPTVATTPLNTDDALALLAHTYVRGHGPARPADLSWWSSLTLAQSRHAFVLAGLQPCQLGGKEFWFHSDPIDSDPPAAALMPPFDESVSYVDKPIDPVRFPAIGPDLARTGGLLFLDGLVAGAWRRTNTARAITVTVTPAGPLRGRHRRALDADAARFAAFAGKAVDLRVVD